MVTLVARAALMLVFLAVVGGCVGRLPVDDPEPLYTPSWAFEPWISKDISDGHDTRAFLEGFRERDIPVGVVVLDSPWETNYNTFVPNEARYPDFAEMVREFRDDDVRTVLWTTQMVNESSFDFEEGGDTYDGRASNFDEGQDNDFFVNNGNTYFWWKGQGSAVDFFNENATDWWHAQQDALLDVGVAGWKLDFGEQYITEFPIRTAQGEKSLQEYSEAYYRDFYEHGAQHVDGGTREFLTMVRPYDESYGFDPRFYARPEHAPVAWVGDQYRDVRGFEDGLDHIFRSAQAGYTMLGSDIGGYLDRQLGDFIPFDIVVFRRWTAASALMGLFQLHGRANLAPWTVPVDDEALVEETVEQYRYWATLHHALVPYLFSITREAQLGRGSARSSMTVIGDDPASWIDDWRFWSGPAFLVAALTTNINDDVRGVALPPTDDGGGYIDWYDLASGAIAPGTTTSFTANAQREVALYVKEGAIVPMRIDSDALAPQLGAAASVAFKDALTVLAFPGPTSTSFTLHDEVTGDVDDAALITLDPNATLRLENVDARVIVRLRVDDASSLDGALVDDVATRAVTSVLDLAEGEPAHYVDVAGRALWVSVPDATDASVAIR